MIEPLAVGTTVRLVGRDYDGTIVKILPHRRDDEPYFYQIDTAYGKAVATSAYFAVVEKSDKP